MSHIDLEPTLRMVFGDNKVKFIHIQSTLQKLFLNVSILPIPNKGLSFLRKKYSFELYIVLLLDYIFSAFDIINNYFFILGSLRSRGFDSNFVMSSQQQLSSANLPYWRSLTGSSIETRDAQIILKP